MASQPKIPPQKFTRDQQSHLLGLLVSLQRSDVKDLPPSASEAAMRKTLAQLEKRQEEISEKLQPPDEAKRARRIKIKNSIHHSVAEVRTLIYFKSADVALAAVEKLLKRFGPLIESDE